MLEKYKRILVTTDFSDVNELAINRATLIAKRENCELILLHVIEYYSPDDGPLSSVFQDNIKANDALSKSVRGKLEKLTSSIDYQNVKAEFRMTPKSARNEILRFAKKHEVDLIVIAPHGKGIIGSLGSTAIGVLNNADCDVLAVREPEK